MGIRFIKYLKYLFTCVLAVVYDDEYSCVICTSEDENSLLCSSCKARIKKCSIFSVVEKEGLNVKCYSSAYYSNIIKEMILRLKYKSDFRCGKVLSELMVEVIRGNNLEFDIITFVPSSKSAIKVRGYNQSEFLANMIGEKTEKEVKNFLVKISETKDQIGLDSESRWKNLKGCFTVRKKKYLLNKKVLLVDDVMTTGATAFYCAKELLNKGSGEIIILTAAKSKI